MGQPLPKNEVLDERSSKQSDERISRVLFSESTALQRIEKAESELELLRSDYLSRIAGMVKAIAAVERSHDKAAEAVVYLENLIAELKPEMEKNANFKRIIEEIRDADIQISDEVAKQIKMRTMTRPVSPSETAAKVLPKSQSKK